MKTSLEENYMVFCLVLIKKIQIWTRETLEQHGFSPEHAPYYIVLLFDNSKEIPFAKDIDLRQRLNTYRAKIRPLSDFIGLK